MYISDFSNLGLTESEVKRFLKLNEEIIELITSNELILEKGSPELIIFTIQLASECLVAATKAAALLTGD